MTRRKNERFIVRMQLEVDAELHAPDKLEADQRAKDLLETLAERLDGGIYLSGGTRLLGDPVLDYRGATFSIEDR